MWNDHQEPDRIYFREFADIIKPPKMENAVEDEEEVIDAEILPGGKTETFLDELLTRVEELSRNSALASGDTTPTPSLYLGRRVEDAEEE